jgi:hypothetical protein
MVNDAEAREAVRQLVKRLEFIAAQVDAMAYVLAKKDSKEYARLLKAAEVAMKTVIQPMSDADRELSAVYATLDDPRADWSKAVAEMLSGGVIELTVEQAIERIKFMQTLDERFDAEMKDKDKSDEDEEPGIGNRG